MYQPKIYKVLITDRVELLLVRMAGRVVDFWRIKLTQPAGAYLSLAKSPME